MGNLGGGPSHKLKGVPVLVRKRAGIQCLQGIEVNVRIVLGKVIGDTSGGLPRPRG
jgi:hypothetical protein